MAEGVGEKGSTREVRHGPLVLGVEGPFPVSFALFLSLFPFQEWRCLGRLFSSVRGRSDPGGRDPVRRLFALSLGPTAGLSNRCPTHGHRRRVPSSTPAESHPPRGSCPRRVRPVSGRGGALGGRTRSASARPRPARKRGPGPRPASRSRGPSWTRPPSALRPRHPGAAECRGARRPRPVRP